MMSSELLDYSPDGGCRSGAGTYYLPKTHMRVTVERFVEIDDQGIEAPLYHQAKVSLTRVPDRHFGYCLDYLAKGTSDDVIQVKRYADSHLLGYVSTDSVDQSGAILKAIIRSVFLGVSSGRARSSTRAKPVVVFDADYDPFDSAQTAVVNEQLKSYGFCLMLETDFEQHKSSIGRYCNQPMSSVKAQVRAPYQLEYRNTLPEERRALGAIFYRPRIPYTYYLFVNDDFGGKGGDGWRLGQSDVVMLENRSPILAVRVDRTFFAQRKTTLVFDQGTLKNVCLYKTAELEEISEIPLEVAKSVVALPTQVFMLRIDQVEGQAALAQAESELLNTQQSYADALDQTAAHQQYSRNKIANPYAADQKGALPNLDLIKADSLSRKGTDDLFKIGNDAICPNDVTPPDKVAQPLPFTTTGGL